MIKKKLFVVLIVLVVLPATIFASVYFFRIKQLPQLTDYDKREEVTLLYEVYRTKSFRGIEDISPEEILLDSNDNYVFVDIREENEKNISIIPGAISFDNFEKDVEDYLDKKIIAYCTIGNRSGQYVKVLDNKNIDAYNLIGGILLWVHDGGEVVSPAGNITKKVHVSRPRWNLLPKGYTGFYNN